MDSLKNYALEDMEDDATFYCNQIEFIQEKILINFSILKSLSNHVNFLRVQPVNTVLLM